MDAADCNDVEWVLFENGHTSDSMFSIARGLEVLCECRGDDLDDAVLAQDSVVDIPVESD